MVDELGIPGLKGGDPVQWGIPNVSSINYSGIGDDTEGPYENKNNTLQFLNNTPSIRGKHTFRFGGEIRRDQLQPGGQPVRARPVHVRPQRHAESARRKTGGDAFADFLLGNSTRPKRRSPIAQAKFRATASPSTSTTPGRSPRS